MSQWVQSKYSKDAKKWEVETEWQDYYSVRIMSHGILEIRSLPKDEYIIVDPPERWEPCTREDISIVNSGETSCLQNHMRDTVFGILWTELRWARSEKDPNAFVIQKKVQP